MATLEIEPSLIKALNKTLETAVSKKMNSVLESIAERYGKGGASFTVEDLLEQFGNDVQIDNDRVINSRDVINDGEVDGKKGINKVGKDPKKKIKAGKDPKKNNDEADEIKETNKTDKKIKTPVEKNISQDVDINPCKCMARVWGDGVGTQCKRSKLDNGEYCGLHQTKFDKENPWHLGRIDEERPNTDHRTDKKISWKFAKLVKVEDFKVKEVSPEKENDVNEQDDKVIKKEEKKKAKKEEKKNAKKEVDEKEKEIEKIKTQINEKEKEEKKAKTEKEKANANRKKEVLKDELDRVDSNKKEDINFTDKKFEEMDKNGDGVIDKAEWVKELEKDESSDSDVESDSEPDYETGDADQENEEMVEIEATEIEINGDTYFLDKKTMKVYTQEAECLGILDEDTGEILSY